MKADMDDHSSVLKISRRAPWWAHTVKLLEDGLPSFKGRGRLLNLVRQHVAKEKTVFPWRMKNANMVGIAPGDIVGSYGVGWTCFRRGSWEPHIEDCLRKLVKKGGVALDIGANIGYFSAVMSECVGKEGCVCAFEPVPDTFIQLTATKECNQYGNLELFNLALGGSNEEKTITFSPNLSGNASFYREVERDAHSVQIKVRTLDSLYSQKTLPECQLIKIDVEGHEMAVFRGGAGYFRKCRPTLIYEFNHDTARAAGYTLSEMQAEIDSWGGGYEHFFVWEGGALMAADMRSVKIPAGCYADFAAIPKAS